MHAIAKPLRAALASFFLLPTIAIAHAGDWPTYMSNTSRDGVTSEPAPDVTTANSALLVQHWAFLSPAPPKPAWPVPQPGWTEHPKVKFDDAFHAIADADTVYFGSSADNCLHALDAKTGSPRWTFFTSGPVRLAPTLANDRIYFGSDDGNVYCVNKTDGALVWSFNAAADRTRVLANGRVASLWSVRTSVLVEGDRAYFGAGVFPMNQTAVYAVDANTGKLIWKNAKVEVYGGFSPQGYLLATKAGIMVPAGRSAPACINRDDGRLLFTVPAVQNFKGETTGVYGVVMDNIFFCGTQNTLFGVNLKGESAARLSNTLRLVPTADSLYSLQGPPPPAYGRRSIATDGNTITALTRTIVPDPAATQPGTPKNIKRWTYKRAGLTSMIVAGKGLFAGADGAVVLIDTQTGKELWTAKVDGSAVGLAFAHGRLIVSTTTGAVYCFAVGEPAKPTAAPPQPQKIDPAVATLAQTIAHEFDLKRGFALIAGNGSASVAVALAQQTDLAITCIEFDPAQVAASRKLVAAAGLYGHRITVELGKPDAIPYPEFAGNLVVQLAGDSRVNDSELNRVLKPCGGMLLAANDASGNGYKKFIRGELPGSGWWTHQYADAGNTGSSGDKDVKGRLGVLWYGEPGGDEAPDRHRRGSAPLVVNGRVFNQGWNFLEKKSSVICFDEYNGLRYWETVVPNALRLELPGVTGNLAANADSVFIAGGPSCYQINAITGVITKKFDIPVPEGAAAKPKSAWGYISVVDGLLLGSACSEDRAAYSDSVFAFDLATGKLRWQHQGREIRNTTVVYADGKIFLADNRYGNATVLPPPNQKKVPKPKPVVPAAKPMPKAEPANPGADQSEDHDGPDDASDSVDRLGKPVVPKFAPVMRTIIALEAATGNQVWEREADLVNCGRWGAGAFGTMQALCKDNVLLFASANTPYGGGPKPEAGPQSALALSTKDGSTLWGNELGNRSRPIFMQNAILAEPNFISIKTGEKLTRPVAAGKEKPWTTGGRAGCGSLSASDSMIFGRSGYSTWSNVAGPGGAGGLIGVRPGCMINIIPAGGVVVQAEASSGCSCYQAVQCTIVLRPVPFDPTPAKKK